MRMAVSSTFRRPSALLELGWSAALKRDSPPCPGCSPVRKSPTRPRPDGTVGSDREPVALFTGEAVHAYLGQLSDAAIEAMLNDLSIELGAALGQERIYVAFAERTWILDAGERSSHG
jgi:hypothetical protein